MPRTFSLARLLLGITMFCAVCGVAVNYPEAALACAYAGGYFGPTIIVWLLLIRFSDHPVLLSVNCLVGVFVGFLFAPSIMWPSSWWDMFVFEAIPPALGALLLGGAALADEFVQRRREQ
jgi:hypothetical protein